MNSLDLSSESFDRTACSLNRSNASSRSKRGLGGSVFAVNHIALIVRDVGTSLYFYTDIIGFKQIARPNFDRHGAWLSMGNVQLHLIKGIPHTKQGQHQDDLIVSHIALEMENKEKVLEKLKLLRNKRSFHWRQNVSVPTFETSQNQIFESDHTDDKGALTQFFIEDPDGYWLEICNCGEDEEPAELTKGSRGRLSARATLRMIFRTLRWIRRARIYSSSAHKDAAIAKELAQLIPILPNQVDKRKLENLQRRRNTYGDPCQGFSEQDLHGALAKAGNDAPGTILILQRLQEKLGTGRVLCPPTFLDDSTTAHFTAAFRMSQCGA
jgi:catechol 2,3-dioxygenase-like lactoylglutathione lyase family enzyme